MSSKNLTLPNGSKIPFSMSSVMLKCKEPTYNLIGPVMVPLVTTPVGMEILFFSAWDAWTMIGTPSSFWSVRPMARGTDSVSLNSMYAIPFERRVLLSVMSRTSRTYNQIKNFCKKIYLCRTCVKSQLKNTIW